MRGKSGALQLPPQMRILFFDASARGMFRDSLENIASQAVAAASGTVAAWSGEVPFGILKDILSSAIVYCEYAPTPFFSPVQCEIESRKTQEPGLFILTTPYKACNIISFLQPGYPISYFAHDAGEVAAEHCAIPKGVGVKRLNYREMSHWGPKQMRARHRFTIRGVLSDVIDVDKDVARANLRYGDLIQCKTRGLCRETHYLSLRGSGSGHFLYAMETLMRCCCFELRGGKSLKVARTAVTLHDYVMFLSREMLSTKSAKCLAG